MGKDLFVIGDLCLITDSKDMKHKNGKVLTRYLYKLIGKKVFYFQNGKYIDIENNKVYDTNFNAVGNYFINIGSIVPFTSFLDENKVRYNSNNLNKKLVRELYNRYRIDKKKD